MRLTGTCDVTSATCPIRRRQPQDRQHDDANKNSKTSLINNDMTRVAIFQHVSHWHVTPRNVSGGRVDTGNKAGTKQDLVDGGFDACGLHRQQRLPTLPAPPRPSTQRENPTQPCSESVRLQQAFVRRQEFRVVPGTARIEAGHRWRSPEPSGSSPSAARSRAPGRSCRPRGSHLGSRQPERGASVKEGRVDAVSAVYASCVLRMCLVCRNVQWNEGG